MTSSTQGVTDTKYPCFVKETKTLYLDWRTTLQARQLGASQQAFELNYGATGAVQFAPTLYMMSSSNAMASSKRLIPCSKKKQWNINWPASVVGEFVPQAKGSVDVMIDHCDHLISYMVRTN